MYRGKRFEVAFEQDSILGSVLIYVDKATGVNYLFVHTPKGAGLTPLLDAYGEPVVTETD
ncbi:DUF6440 family protein [uncultured Faecalibaculum sp.]|uniref:DUF6440 family protein n=1 Tax=uncultured Faecalibaculum sp. TaxID=1729681 RepID=UPI00262329C7|nr:DUF6440 family protein [uncultured Faecalibaculum sp.]